MKWLAPILALLALAGCSGNAAKSNAPAVPPAATELDSYSALRIAKADQALAHYCVAILGTGDAGNRQALAEIHGVDTLIEIARAHPNAIIVLTDRRTMRQVLSDAASVLDNGNCQPAHVRKLERALATL